MRPGDAVYSWRRVSRENALIEIARLRRLQTLPVERILASQVEAFGTLIGKRLRDRTLAFGRDYVRAIVDKVVVNGDTATISGSNAKLMRTVGAKKPLAGQVPSFIHEWCPSPLHVTQRRCGKTYESGPVRVFAAAGNMEWLVEFLV
jgi:hypothetical protein